MTHKQSGERRCPPRSPTGRSVTSRCRLPTSRARPSSIRKVFGWTIRTRGNGAVAFDDTVGQVSGSFVRGVSPRRASRDFSFTSWWTVSLRRSTPLSRAGDDHPAGRRRCSRDHRPVRRPGGKRARAVPAAGLTPRVKVIIFGATGMVRHGDAARVPGRSTRRRRAAGLEASCRREPSEGPRDHSVGLLRFFEDSPQFVGFDACFFCLGVSSVGMSEGEYRRVTFDLTMAAATAIASVTADGSRFVRLWRRNRQHRTRPPCVGTHQRRDRERVGAAARSKTAFMFRPGYIQPLRGIRSKRRGTKRCTPSSARSTVRSAGWPQRFVTTTANLGRAMIQVAANGYSKQILRSDDINRLAAS